MATIAGTYFIKLPCVNVIEEKDTESVLSLHQVMGAALEAEIAGNGTAMG